MSAFPLAGAGVGLLRGAGNSAGAFARYAGADDPALTLALGPPGAGEPWLECVVAADSGEPSGTTSHLLVVAFAVPGPAWPAFDDWYDSEHAPLLLEAPGWLRVRRLRATTVAPGELNCYVLHDLDGLAVLDGPERARAKAGPKRAAVATQPWYASSTRWLFRPAD